MTHPLLWACALSLAIAVIARPRPPVRRPHAEPPRSDSTSPPSTLPTLRARRSRPKATTTTEVAQWSEALARAVRGGDTLPLALSRTPAPAGHAALVEQLATNLERTGHLGDVPHGAPADLALVLAVVTTCIEHGGPAAEPLDRAAGVLRARAADHADRQIHSAQARLSAQVLTVLPAAMLTILVVSSSSVRSTLVTPTGAVLLSVGATLNVAGWGWMRRIIDRAAR